MRKLITIVITILIFKQFSLSQIGSIVVCPQLIYEEENSYFPHDYFIQQDLGELLNQSLELEQSNNKYLLINSYNDGFTGHKIQIEFNDKLEILQANYNAWTDMIDGSITSYKVENIIFSTNQNPIKTPDLLGHYTLQIREDFKAGEILNNEGIGDTTYYWTFNGKFKFYNDKEKSNGLEWVKSQNEIKLGLKDSLNVYSLPDYFAEYKYGDEELNKILSKYTVKRSETKLKRKVFILVNAIVSSEGKINPNSMEILDKMNSERILNLLKEDDKLLNNWIPGKRKGKAVKSKINLTIMVQE